MSDDLFGDIEAFINAPKEHREPLFTHEEYQHLIYSFASSREDKGFTEDEAVDLLEWCDSIRLRATLLELVLKGLALIGWENGEPTFRISPLGIEVAKYDGA